MFDFIFTWMWLIVSGIFFSIAINSIPDVLKFKNNARKTTGHIKAIEKYKSTSGSGTDRVTRTYYRPLIEYTYNDKTYVITDAGHGRLSYKIGQRINILLETSADHEAVYATADNSNNFQFSILLMAMSSIFAFIYIIAMNGSVVLVASIFTILTLAGHFISTVLRKKHGFVSRSDTIWTAGQESVIIEDHQDYNQELSTQKRNHNFITLLFLMIGCVCVYIGYKDIPNEAQTALFSNFSLIKDKIQNSQLEESWTKSFLLIGFGFYCIVSCLLGAIMRRKKYRLFSKK